MGQPKKRTSARRTGGRRSRLVLQLARAVNRRSPVKAFTTVRETGSKKATLAVVETSEQKPKTATKKSAAPVASKKKPSVKKAA